MGNEKGLEGGPTSEPPSFRPLGSLGVSQAPGPAPHSLASQSQPLSASPAWLALPSPMGPGNQSSWSPTKYFSRLRQGPSGDGKGAKELLHLPISPEKE